MAVKDMQIELCGIKLKNPVIPASGSACASVKLPARVRRRPAIHPPQPSACPMSWQSVRIYVPLEQRTRRV